MEAYDKLALLEKIQAGRAGFDALLARFPADGLESSYPPVGWSVKDMLGHITYWENITRQYFHTAANGVRPGVPNLTNDDLDRINGEVLRVNQKRPLAEMQADYTQVYQELWPLLAAMPEDEVDPWWNLWPHSTTPLDWIGYTTYGHYEEHAADLRRWLNE